MTVSPGGQAPATASIPASASDSADLPTEAAAALLQAEFGIVARTLTPLASERDQNIHVAAEDGAAYLLKASHHQEDEALIALQTAALRHIAAVDPGLATPRVIPTRAGRDAVHAHAPDGTARIVRLMSFLRGALLHRAPRSRRQRVQLGRTLARLGLALREFKHPRAERDDLLWDLQRVAALRPLAGNVQDDEHRKLAEAALDNFEINAAPVLAKLPRQAIHNDFNLHNVLVAADDPEHVVGVLDFGDMVLAPIVCDLAVGAAYQSTEGAEPLDGVSDFIAGYNGLRPLNESEIDILFDLILARLAATVLITETRAKTHPDNRAYLLRNHPLAVAGLRRMTTLSRSQAKAVFSAVCSAETIP